MFTTRHCSWLQLGGWFLVASGGGSLCLIARALVLAEDIGSSEVIVFAALMGHFAVVSIALGALTIWDERNPVFPFVARADERPK